MATTGRIPLRTFLESQRFSKNTCLRQQCSASGIGLQCSVFSEARDCLDGKVKVFMTARKGSQRADPGWRSLVGVTYFPQFVYRRLFLFHATMDSDSRFHRACHLENCLYSKRVESQKPIPVAAFMVHCLKIYKCLHRCHLHSNVALCACKSHITLLDRRYGRTTRIRTVRDGLHDATALTEIFLFQFVLNMFSYIRFNFGGLFIISISIYCVMF